MLLFSMKGESLKKAEQENLMAIHFPGNSCWMTRMTLSVMLKPQNPQQTSD